MFCNNFLALGRWRESVCRSFLQRFQFQNKMKKIKKYIKPAIEVTCVEMSNGILESTYIDIGGSGGKPFDSPEYPGEFEE